jgi:hypothetical protein
MAETRRVAEEVGRRFQARKVSLGSVKLKLPLVDLWLVTGRRLKAGYARRYQHGYANGWEDGSAEPSRHAAEVRGHSDTVPEERDSGGTEPRS